MKNQWTFVDTPAKLVKAEKRIQAASVIALDTEYDSFRYFREILCLLQIQTGQKTWLIDTLAGLDLSFLEGVLADPNILKIFHAGDNDIRILKRDYSFDFKNIFDTYRAASLLGFRKLSLTTLLETHIGVKLEKKMQRSRWDLRPLTEEQMQYAALDTVYLPRLYEKFNKDLKEKGLSEAAARIFEEMVSVVWQPKVLDRSGHRNINGYAKLTKEQQERLRLLFCWRFEKARELNRARFMILSDSQMVALSRLETPSQDTMVGPGLLSAETADRFGAEIADLLKSG